MSDEQPTDAGSDVHCARCQRAPRDGTDFVVWQELDEGCVCPGCLTMLEAHARGTAE